MPPTGPGPPEDVLRVVEHPAGERARRNLARRDVRYVVLYTRMPDGPVAGYWRSFDTYPDLYRIVFENADVLVVAPSDVPNQRV